MFAADIVLKNANVITIDPRRPYARAVAIFRDKIIAVGDDLEVENLAGPGTKVVNLGGKTLMPGFNDAHNHMLMYGTGLMEIDCTSPPVKSIGEIKQIVAQERQKNSSRRMDPGRGLR